MRSLIAHLLVCSISIVLTDGFSMVMMARRGKGSLQRSLDTDDMGGKKGVASLNKGKGQEITGVTLPLNVSVV
jgi:hypothetical protein